MLTYQTLENIHKFLFKTFFLHKVSQFKRVKVLKARLFDLVIASDHKLMAQLNIESRGYHYVCVEGTG